MHTLTPLTWDEFCTLYHTAMAADFPAAEIKPLSLLQRLWGEGVCRAWALTDPQGARCAYAVIEQPADKGVCLLDYLAVNSAMRGQGIGGEMLRRLSSMYPAILLEIERVERAAGPAQHDERTRRRRFYLKNGACPTGVFTRADGGLEYEILCLAAAPLADAAAAAMERIYQTLFAPGEYDVWEEIGGNNHD